MRLYSSDFGVVGDWNGTTGTDNKTAIEAMISASNSSQPWCIDQDNVGVSSIVIDSKDNYEYMYDDDIPEDDEESEACPFGGADYDEIWKHKFVNVP